MLPEGTTKCCLLCRAALQLQQQEEEAEDKSEPSVRQLNLSITSQSVCPVAVSVIWLHSTLIFRQHRPAG